MSVDIKQLIAAREVERYQLHASHLNEQMVHVLKTNPLRAIPALVKAPLSKLFEILKRICFYGGTMLPSGPGTARETPALDSQFRAPSTQLKYPLHLLLHGAALAILLATFGRILHSGSADVVSHLSLVEEIMKHGRVRPDALNLGSMHFYTPFSHWLGAVLGWLIGSGLIAILLISIVAVYVSYYVVGRILVAESSVLSLIAFVALYGVLAQTYSLTGWEVIGNFFYPQLVAFAMYLLALMWLALRHPAPSHVALFVVFFSPLIYLAQPLGGVHFTATVVATLAADALALILAERRFSTSYFFAAGITVAVAIAVLFLPTVRQVVSDAVNDGILDFNFPGDAYALAFAVCVAASLANLVIGLRSWPSGHVNRVLGAAGVAAGGLMALSFALWVLGSGSPYAVKKHGFILVMLGAMNLARLVAYRFPKEVNRPWAPYAVALLAFCATASVGQAPGEDVTTIIAAQRFAKRFTETSSIFRPGNTTAYVGSLGPLVNFLISTTSFEAKLDAAFNNYGKLDGQSLYVMIDRRLASETCLIEANNTFAVVPTQCVGPISPIVRNPWQ
jgi:hypothetical protein